MIETRKYKVWYDRGEGNVLYLTFTSENDAREVAENLLNTNRIANGNLKTVSIETIEVREVTVEMRVLHA